MRSKKYNRIVASLALIAIASVAMVQLFSNRNKIKYKLIDMNHSTVEELTSVSQPMSVSKNKKGELYISDFSDHSVKVFDTNLKLVKQIGGRGSEEGKFVMPHAVDFDTSGQLFITDYGNKRIQIFSQAGDYISTLQSDRELVGPATAYFDKDYNLYVSDFGSGSIDKYSPEGKFLGWIGAKADGIVTDGWENNKEASQPSELLGGFQKVHSVKFDQKGIMYVADMGNHRIQRFTKDGKFNGWIGAKEDGSLTDGWEMSATAKKSDIAGGFDSPIAIDFINNDELVILEYGNSRIQRFSNDGKFIGWFGGVENGGYTDGWKTAGLAREGSGKGEFRKPYDLRVYDNKIYVVDTSNSRVEIINFTN